MEKGRSAWRKNLWKILSSILAAAILALLFLGTYEDRAKRQSRQEYSVVVLGDSIFGVCRDETAVTEKLSDYLGVSVFNGALGGTCLSRMDTEKRMGYSKDSLSLAGMAKAIAADDFGVQQTTRIRESATEYFAETIDELETIDFEQVEILLLEYGLNDYHGGARLYNGADPLDEYSFAGALRSSLTELKKKYPDLRIVLLTPTYSWYTVTGVTCEELNAGYGYLEDFVEAEIQIAREQGVEIVDLYHDFYPHEKWEDWNIYTFDGLHPNEEGRELIAQKVTEYLEKER